jgi:fatty acid desaturase
MFVYVRGVAEHFGSMEYDEELGSTRTVNPYFWERWFFGPHNINYHLEHHLFPGVPFYNLPKLHAVLMSDGAYRSKAHVTRGYSTGLVRECLA